MEYRVRFIELRGSPEELRGEFEAVCSKVGIEGFRLVHRELGLVAATHGIYLFFERS
ncbi:MAG: hypothetical protein IVW36_05020 [Dehalococcoidia bacterium]|nr:hypothetical protein [Dehalococcoidia bacterium]